MSKRNPMAVIVRQPQFKKKIVKAKKGKGSYSRKGGWGC